MTHAATYMEVLKCLFGGQNYSFEGIVSVV